MENLRQRVLNWPAWGWLMLNGWAGWQSYWMLLEDSFHVTLRSCSAYRCPLVVGFLSSHREKQGLSGCNLSDLAETFILEWGECHISLHFFETEPWMIVSDAVIHSKSGLNSTLPDLQKCLLTVQSRIWKASKVVKGRTSWCTFS